MPAAPRLRTAITSYARPGSQIARAGAQDAVPWYSVSGQEHVPPAVVEREDPIAVQVTRYTAQLPVQGSLVGPGRPAGDDRPHDQPADSLWPTG